MSTAKLATATVKATAATVKTVKATAAMTSVKTVKPSDAKPSKKVAAKPTNIPLTKVPTKALKDASFKIGQKYKTPVDTEPLFKFYTSLYKQKKSSAMAIKWCIEHGIFTEKKATKLLLDIQMSKLKI